MTGQNVVVNPCAEEGWHCYCRRYSVGFQQGSPARGLGSAMSQSQGIGVRPSRRTIAKGAAWAVPVIAVGAAAPHASASPLDCVPDLHLLRRLVQVLPASPRITSWSYYLSIYSHRHVGVQLFWWRAGRRRDLRPRQRLRKGLGLASGSSPITLDDRGLQRGHCCSSRRAPRPGKIRIPVLARMADPGRVPQSTTSPPDTRDCEPERVGRTAEECRGPRPASRGRSLPTALQPSTRRCRPGAGGCRVATPG